MDANQSVSLSPTQATPPSSQQSGISSIPIRAPLSFDSDFESALKTHSRSSSSSSDSVSSAKSFDSEEEGFLSGEDGFETASERPSVQDPDEENLELAMEEEDFGLVVDKPVLGSSSFSITPPKARISGETDDDDDDVVVASEVVDDGVSTVVKVPIAAGLMEGEDGGTEDESLVENGLVSENTVLDLGSVELAEDKVLIGAEAVDEVLAVSKEDILPENPNLGGFVESSVNGVLDSEGNKSLLEENSVLDSGSVELVGDGVSDSIDLSNEVLVMSKEDILPENLKLEGVVNPENEGGEKGEVEKKDEAVQEKKSEEEVGGTRDEVVDEKNSEPLTIETNHTNQEDAVPIDSKVVEEDKELNSTSRGDLLVEAKPVLLGPESGGVGDVEENPISEAKPLEAVVNSSVSVAVVSDQAPAVTEESDDKAVEALTEESDDKAVESHIEESGGVHDVEENPISETKPLEVEVNSSVSVLDVSDQAPVVIEESDDKAVEALTEESGDVHDVENPISETKPLEVEVNSSVSMADVSNQAPVVIEESGDVRDVEENPTPEAKPLEVEVNSAVRVVSDQSPAAIAESDDLKVAEVLIEESSGVRYVQENPTSDGKPLEVEANDSVSVHVVSDQSSAVIEKSDDLKAVEALINIAKADDENGELSASQKNLEPVEDSAIEMQEPVAQESKTEAVEVQKDDEKDCTGAAISLSLDPDTNRPELESEPQTDRGFGEAQSADSCTKHEEADIVQENTTPVLSTKSSDRLEDVVSNSSPTPKTTVPRSIFSSEVKEEAEVDRLSDYGEEEAEGSVSDEDNEELNFGSSGTAEQIMKELMRGSGVSFNSGAQSSQDNSQRIDGQIILDSDEEVDTDEESEGKELFDSAALAALLKAATSAGPEGGNVSITSQDGSRLFSVERPAGLGSSIRSSKPASQPSRPNIFTSSDLMAGGESENLLSEEEKKKLEKLQLVRVKFLRLIHRLGHSADDAIAAQVLYRMVLAAGRQTGQAFSLESAKKTAMQLEAEKSEDLDFSLNILVLGKTGVGKSATINSIFGEEKAKIGAFEPATTTVKEIIGTVGGVKIRVFDTPGLMSSVMEQAFNRKVLSSVKKLTKKFPLDILLYVDRLDTQTRDLNDLPMLRTITNTLGSSIWRSAVVTLTHAASAPPDGPSGSPLSYEVFVAQRSHIVQQSIGQAVGDLRMMNPSLMNPVSLVENHPSCRKNREGQRVLPNGQSWRPQLLLLCYSLKVLSEVSSLSKPQDPFDHRKLFGFRVRAPPLPYLLSSLLQSRAHPKLPDDQGGENVDSDIDLEDLSDSEQEEEEDEYDQLPPFKPLRKSQIAKLSKDQRKAYFDEYDYRVKLLQKKQWKEELKRMKDMKKKGKDQTDNVDYIGEDADQEGPAAVPVPLPDMVLPPSFDGDNPAYRYRFLEPTSQLLARPVLDTHGWDHDCGYDGVSLEENLAIAGRFPGGVAVQITKDKKEFNIHLDSSIAAKHGENGSSLAGFDIQTIGKQLGYIVRGETKFKNFKKNKTTGGISVTFLGENVATGVKVEDQICIGKRLTLVGSTGTIRSQGDAAYGANLEARLKEKDFPIGQDQSTLGLSLMRWRGDLALGANLQSQISIGRSSKISIRVGLNNKLSGQITVRTSSSEQLQLALVGLLPIVVSIYKSIWPSAGEGFSAY